MPIILIFLHTLLQSYISYFADKNSYEKLNSNIALNVAPCYVHTTSTAHKRHTTHMYVNVVKTFEYSLASCMAATAAAATATDTRTHGVSLKLKI